MITMQNGLSQSQQKFTRCPVLYDDGVLIAVNKPSGLLSHPNPSKPGPSHLQKSKSAAAFEGNYDFKERRFDTPKGPLWLIHRLDQDASGILLAAWSQNAARQCRQSFEALKVSKIYTVLVQGCPHPPKGKWKDFMMERRMGGKVRTRIGRGGKPNAELTYSVKKTFSFLRASLVEVKLITGRTHQIRVQFASHGYPVAGDGVYGDFLWNRKLKKTIHLKRLFLHSTELAIPHPERGELLTFTAPLPEELKKTVPEY